MTQYGLVVVAAAAVLLAPATLSAQDIGLPLGAQAPVVTVDDLDGKPVDLGRYVGKGPVLLEFWATWCPLCAALEPALKAAYVRYGTAVRFFAIGVAVNQSPASIRRHLASHPLPFPVLYDGDGAAVRAFDALTTSYIVVLDRTGKVSYTGTGEDQDVAAALRQVAAAP